jgi:endo-1,4-beta-D-glucanase Y
MFDRRSARGLCLGALLVVACSGSDKGAPVAHQDAAPPTGGSGGAGGSPGTGGTPGTGGAAPGDAAADSAAPAPDSGAAADTGVAGLSHPFGAHALKYPDGVLRPTGTMAAVDKAVTDYYDQWSARYLVEKCNGYVILTEGGTGAADGTFSVSEGHGYGMVISALMAGHDPKARAKFDGLYSVFREYPSSNSPDLMAWQLLSKCPAKEMCTMPGPGCFRINGDASGSATDGDLDVAFGLLLADKQWGSAGPINYLAEAKKVIGAIKGKEMNPMTKLPLLADDVVPTDDTYFMTRPSDFMVDHFRAYGAATGDAFWMQSVDSIHTLLGTLQTTYSMTTGLIPDFVVSTNTTARPAPPNNPADEGPTTGEYSYNSCRVPWHLATDYVVSGDARARAEVVKLDDWIRKTTAGDATKIQDGYKLNGTPGTGVSGPDLSFTAPFGVAAILGGDQKWLDALWSSMSTAGLSSYYGDTINVLAMIVVSGNWWAP